MNLIIQALNENLEEWEYYVINLRNGTLFHLILWLKEIERSFHVINSFFSLNPEKSNLRDDKLQFFRK